MSKAKKAQLPRQSSVTTALKLETTKGRMLVFAVAFVIVGGAIMAYKSHAATTGSTALYNNISAVTQPARIIVETSGVKKSTNVWSLGVNGSAVANITLPILTPNSQFNICANLKANKSGSVGFSFSSAAKGGVQSLPVTASNDYKSYCMPMSYIDAYAYMYQPGIVNNTTGDIRIGSISLTYESQYVSYTSYTSYTSL